MLICLLGAVTGGERLNLDVVQCALGVRPSSVPAGKPFEAILLLQNASDVNVDVTAPDVLSAGFQTTIVQSAGSMTLYMEMYDSATSKLLARVIDPEADDRAFAQAANRATNQQAADKILSGWAELLAKHLGDVTHK